MKLLLRLAWRNILRNRRRTVIIVLAMSLGMGMMMFYDGLMAGFNQAIYGNAIKVLGGNVQVHAEGYRLKASQNPLLALADDQAILEFAFAQPQVMVASRRIKTGGLVSSHEGAYAVSITGIEPEQEAQVNLAAVSEKPLGPGFSLDAGPILSEGAKLTAVCQPNNPTANLFDRREVARILSESEGIVILDEAYGDFCGSDMLRDALAAPRTIDTRTFSKAYGLAGLRAGFAIARKEVVDELRRVRTPFGLNSFAEAVATRALDHKRWVQEKVSEMKVERAYLDSRLTALGFQTYPSECNYVTAKCPVRGTPFVAALKSRGVAVRDCSSFATLEDHIRVTVGPRWMMDKMLAEAEAVISGEAR